MKKEYDVNYSVDNLIKDNPNLQEAVHILIQACIDNELYCELRKYDNFRSDDFRKRALAEHIEIKEETKMTKKEAIKKLGEMLSSGRIIEQNTSCYPSDWKEIDLCSDINEYAHLLMNGRLRYKPEPCTCKKEYRAYRTVKKEWIGKIVIHKTSDTPSIIISIDQETYKPFDSLVSKPIDNYEALVGTMHYTAERLFKDFTWEDGSPIGEEC